MRDKHDRRSGAHGPFVRGILLEPGLLPISDCLNEQPGSPQRSPCEMSGEN